MKSLLPMLLAFGALLLPTVAQKPRTVDEAVARFEEVREQAERNRHRAVRDLARYSDDRVTRILLQELERAETISYRQTVVRAIGQEARAGVVGPLQTVLVAADNPRLADSAAEAIAGQGEVGAAALAALLQSAGGRQGVLRNAVCNALGRANTATGRAALLADVQRAGGRDRLPPLRGLQASDGDADVDALRRQLAGDKDPLVAATALEQLVTHGHPDAPGLAIELSRRLAPDNGADLHAAVLMGLLQQPTAAHYDAILTAAAYAEDAFGEARRPAWQRACEQADFVIWLGGDGAGKKALPERIAIARALALAPDNRHDLAVVGLGKLLQQRDADVVQAAATALVKVGGEAAQAALAELARKDQADTVAIAIGALNALRHADPGFRDELLLWSADRQPAARAAALRALARTPSADDRLLRAAEQNLGHKDWRVRAAAIELCAATRSAAAPPLLFARLDKESARLRHDLDQALRELTGLQFATSAEWKQWWANEGATFQPVAAKRPDPASGDGRGDDRRQATGASYWNIPVQSDRVTFVVDVSGSMLQPFGAGDDTRLDEAKRQLQQVFGQLSPKARINVIAFAADGKPLFDDLQSLDNKRRKLADAYVLELLAKGPTNVHAALQAAFSDPDVDTIFLLTDGRPSVGAIVAPEALAQEVARWNLALGVRIHTIAIGERSEFLERLANDSGGEHTVAR